MYKKDIQHQFSKYSKEYNKYNIIQQIVSKALVRELKDKPKKILELGCGSGQVFRNIDFDFVSYTALDFSQEMCNIHPKSNNLDIKCINFDNNEFSNYLEDKEFDIVLSSSALQWSKDLARIIKTLSKVSNKIDMVLFTSNTFKTIFTLSNKKSPILNAKNIKDSFDLYYNCTYEIINYKIEFDTKKELFNYIKNSGVGGGNSALPYKEAKYLYKNYTLNYLEFEVIFVKGVSNKN